MSGATPPADAVSAAVTHTFREERAIVLATLIRQVGDFQLAEDAVQDAFEAAVTVWRRDGVPVNPGAWVTTAARRRAIDRLRRNRSVTDRAERLVDGVHCHGRRQRARRREGIERGVGCGRLCDEYRGECNDTGEY